MAKKPAPKSSAPAPKVIAAKPAAAPVAEAAPVVTTPIRKTVAPKAAPVAKKTPTPITYERIAERAYYISRSGHGGSEHENWLRAEAELKNENV